MKPPALEKLNQLSNLFDWRAFKYQKTTFNDIHLIEKSSDPAEENEMKKHLISSTIQLAQDKIYDENVLKVLIYILRTDNSLYAKAKKLISECDISPFLISFHKIDENRNLQFALFPNLKNENEQELLKSTSLIDLFKLLELKNLEHARYIYYFICEKINSAGFNNIINKDTIYTLTSNDYTITYNEATKIISISINKEIFEFDLSPLGEKKIARLFSLFFGEKLLIIRQLNEKKEQYPKISDALKNLYHNLNQATATKEIFDQVFKNPDNSIQSQKLESIWHQFFITFESFKNTSYIKKESSGLFSYCLKEPLSEILEQLYDLTLKVIKRHNDSDKFLWFYDNIIFNEHENNSYNNLYSKIVNSFTQEVKFSQLSFSPLK